MLSTAVEPRPQMSDGTRIHRQVCMPSLCPRNIDGVASGPPGPELPAPPTLDQSGQAAPLRCGLHKMGRTVRDPGSDVQGFGSLGCSWEPAPPPPPPPPSPSWGQVLPGRSVFGHSQQVAPLHHAATRHRPACLRSPNPGWGPRKRTVVSVGGDQDRAC